MYSFGHAGRSDSSFGSAFLHFLDDYRPPGRRARTTTGSWARTPRLTGTGVVTPRARDSFSSRGSGDTHTTGPGADDVWTVEGVRESTKPKVVLMVFRIKLCLLCRTSLSCS